MRCICFRSGFRQSLAAVSRLDKWHDGMICDLGHNSLLISWYFVAY